MNICHLLAILVLILVARFSSGANAVYEDLNEGQKSLDREETRRRVSEQYERVKSTASTWFGEALDTLGIDSQTIESAKKTYNDMKQRVNEKLESYDIDTELIDKVQGGLSKIEHLATSTVEGVLKNKRTKSVIDKTLEGGTYVANTINDQFNDVPKDAYEWMRWVFI